jgi:diketogulonate reductase-like aldo/keto reductase
MALVGGARARGAFGANSSSFPKSTHRERIEQNVQIFDFTLADDDMAALGRARRALRDRPGTRTPLVVTLTATPRR